MLEEMGAPRAAPRPWAVVPGPVDRVSFFDEQRKRRRSTWRLSAIGAVVVVALGLLFSLIVVPLLIAQTYVVLGVLDIFLPLPHLVYLPVDAYGNVLQHVGDVGDSRLRTTIGLLGVAAPGVVVLLLLWFWLRRLFRRAGIGGVLLTLGAREPRPNDLEERQLVNVIEEMAIAGGIGRPRVMLLDDGPANAAAVGSGPDNATIIVSRRLLDEFDRDETQGTLAQLVAAIGNGDLGVGLTIMSVFQTYGLAQMLINLPVSPTARSAVWKLLRLSARGPQAGKDGEADLINTMLGGAYISTLDEFSTFFDRAGDSSRPLISRIPIWIGAFLFFPLMLASVFGGIAIGMVELFLLGPLLALIWRSRCYLADATAVQLTRNPDSLARGLRSLAEDGGVLPAGRAVSYLFVVGTEVAEGRAQRKMIKQFMSSLPRDQGKPTFDQVRAAMVTFAAAHEEREQEEEAAKSGTFEEKQGLVVSLHPPLDKRLKRLLKMGASGESLDVDIDLDFQPRERGGT